MVTPIAIRSIGWQYYIVFAVIAACIPVSVYFLYPETMGRSLEEIDLMFKQAPSAWTAVQYEKQSRGSMSEEFEEKKANMVAELKHSEG